MTARRLRQIDEVVEGKHDGELTVQALAEGLGLSAGFSSHAHLSATFRQKLGISPNALRRSLAAARISSTF